MTEQLEIDPCTIALHPIHDADHRHVADRVAYRQQDDPESDDTMAAAARALASAVYELGDAGLLGNRTLFATLPSEWLDRPELLPTPAPRMALGVADAERVDDTLLARLDEIRERGYRVVVPASLLNQDVEALLPRTDIVTLASTDALAADLLAQLPQRKIKLLVENIRTPEELARYRQMGCHFYNGDYLARPSFIAARPRGRHGNRAAQIRLIRALYDDDTDLQTLQELVVQMPHLHVAILRRANSSYFNRGGKEVDLSRGMQVLGQIELRRLILTLTLASLQPSSRIVLRMALQRAFMCRNLSAPFAELDPEDAFTTGLFSLMDALLEQDRDTLFEQLPLSQPILRALRHREGALGAVLQLCEDHERQLEASDSQTPSDRLHQCYLDALDSTRSLMGHL
ncbi:HDOD domain-containing protein [Halomonas campisalis]|uniref:HDOD domain-containing protein n=1 Tax=Billgrantia campisalis TaxID=74661 RepID=A0ABS9P341_9GAMM|nr:HDOD domain-containing protein [Halomonas campisalis]MCG6656196.1 HDOD domain-containing protein [Halomonas campisalis]MDR5861382.1 HDOD domain-containing protein [Halomonas campisalis]